MTFSKFEALDDDGYKTQDIGAWGEVKYRVVSHYAALFSQSMKDKWDFLIYLDLFAGAGRSRIRENNKIINSSSLSVLGLSQKFDQYIFNDSDSINSDALKNRGDLYYPNSNISVLSEDVNESILKIISKMPTPHSRNKILSFCFLDPFKMDNLKFATIQKLSQRYMDFLVLIPTDMDAKRNLHNFLPLNNNTVESFIGNEQWREKWKDSNKKVTHFGEFIIDEFGQSMSNLGYITPKASETYPIKNVKNRIIYRLSFYSKSKVGYKFWQETKKYTNPQKELFDLY